MGAMADGVNTDDWTEEKTTFESEFLAHHLVGTGLAMRYRIWRITSTS